MPQTISELDAILLRQDTTRAARQRVATMLPLVKPHLQTVKNLAPSYVADAVAAMMAAFDRWTEDERVAMESSRNA